MRSSFLIMVAATIAAASVAQAQDHPFSGPRVGLEVAYENFGSGTDGATLAAQAGWDFALGDKWVVGAQGRYAFVGVENSETNVTPGGPAQTSNISIRDNWGVGARVGRVVGDRVLVFGEAGYERLRLEAKRTLSTPSCAPPRDCLISREDFSFNEDLWTLGAGAEWALTRNVRLRGLYTYGDSKAFDRHRLSLGVGWQF